MGFTDVIFLIFFFHILVEDGDNGTSMARKEVLYCTVFFSPAFRTVQRCSGQYIVGMEGKGFSPANLVIGSENKCLD